MNTFEEQINGEIIRVWEENIIENENENYMPIFYSNLVKNRLLFIGINPSFSTIAIDKLFQLITNHRYDSNEYFKWKNRANFSTKLSNDLDNKIRENYPYFKKFRDIAKYTELEWEHIDLFHNRVTNQEKLKEIIFAHKNKKELNKFGEDQIKIFKKVLKYISPQIIIIANALASNIFENEFDVSFQNDTGYHIVEINHKIVPLFLSSMLTGQRALDNYSYKRLKWHIKTALENSKQLQA